MGAFVAARGVVAIDRRALDKLQEIVGGEEADLVELIDSFLEEAPGLVAALAAAQQAADLAGARRAAHSLKSNARDMGASELAELCARLEAQCVAGDLPTLDAVEGARLTFVAAASELRAAYPAAARWAPPAGC
jgi:HPt (histidine-containing phosphotransfer) domain-containing protein